jgi:hypothetical protein
MDHKLSDSELVKRVRGVLSQIEFATTLEVVQSMVSDWERGAHSPSERIWVKMAEFAGRPESELCWERAGLSQRSIKYLQDGLAKAGNPPKPAEKIKARHELLLASPIEPGGVIHTERLPDESRAKLFDDLVKKYGGPENLDAEKSRAMAAALKEAGFPVFGILPTETETGKGKPVTSAKKAKRERRPKK